MLRMPMHEGQKVPQAGLNPDVRSAPLRACVGGPCDGDAMRCPDGYRLILTDAVDGLRATALKHPDAVNAAKQAGGYAGHYENGPDNALHFVAP